MVRRPRRCADAAIDGLVHDRWLMRRLLAMLRPAGFEAPRSRGYGYLASRTELHVHTGRPWSQSAAERWTDRAWNGWYPEQSGGLAPVNGYGRHGFFVIKERFHSAVIAKLR
jgi:hypothetical protein